MITTTKSRIGTNDEIKISNHDMVPSLNAPSKLARSLFGARAAWSPTARLDEHRLSKNTIDLVYAFGDQGRPTALALPIFSASGTFGGDPSSATPLHCLAALRSPVQEM
jgi:hypothetical protein